MKKLKLLSIFASVMMLSVVFVLYACSTNSNELAPETSKNTAKHNNKSVERAWMVIVSESSFGGGELTPTCDCSTWLCQAKGYCMNGKTCACSCGFWNGCSCTPCARSIENVPNRKIAIRGDQRQKAIELEAYLLTRNNTNLNQVSQLLTDMRVGLENENIDTYLDATEALSALEPVVSQQEKSVIQQWFNDNNISIVI